MNKILSGVLFSASLLLGSGSVAAYEIEGGALDGTDVGLLDMFVDWQTGPFTGGAGNPSGEESWANSILDPDTVYTVKNENVQMHETDGDNIRAFALEDTPAYFIVKNSTFRALFENQTASGYGVINVALLESLGGFNLSGDDQLIISHVTEFGSFVDPDPDPDPDPEPMPAPGTLLLLGIGLLLARRTKAKE